MFLVEGILLGVGRILIYWDFIGRVFLFFWVVELEEGGWVEQS